jgi:CRISPR-associated protein Cas2
MMILILEKVTPSLRGEISRWLIEPKAGVFVGKVSAMVRDKLWEKCLRSIKKGSVVQLWSTNNEQGFSGRTYGDRTRELIDIEGLLLVRYVSEN